MPHMIEARGYDLSKTDIFTFHIQLFVYNPEMISLLNAKEIYGPGIDLRKFISKIGIDLIVYHGVP